jgi:hypothetical protein
MNNVIFTTTDLRLVKHLETAEASSGQMMMLVPVPQLKSEEQGFRISHHDAQ